MTEHTPTPWEEFAGEYDVHFVFATLDGVSICEATRAENAKFIVRACNAHDELVAACEALVDSAYQPADAGSLAEKARAAIAKAKEGE